MDGFEFKVSEEASIKKLGIVKSKSKGKQEEKPVQSENLNFKSLNDLLKTKSDFNLKDFIKPKESQQTAQALN
jgi:predicted transcriptional regulator